MCSLCWNWLQCALIDLWTFVYLCYSLKSFTNKARQNCFYLPRKIISIMSVGRKFSLSCAYISKLLLRVRNRDIYACIHPHIHICMHAYISLFLWRGEGEQEWSEVRGEKKEKETEKEEGGNGGEGDRPDNSSVQKIPCLFSM